VALRKEDLVKAATKRIKPPASNLVENDPSCR